MAHDASATQQKIYDAAIAEFAAHGPAGTTMERLAAAAGVNKERIYAYFGTKQQLFMHVLAGECEQIVGSIGFLPSDPDPVGDYAGRVFDYHSERPELNRLLLWEGLTVADEVTEDTLRTTLYRRKREAFAEAQRQGYLRDDLDPGHLAFLIMAVINWWSTAPHIDRMLSGKEGEDATARRERQRAAAVAAAKAIATPQ